MVKDIDSQVLYQGRWVEREPFRVFVYNKDKKNLCNSYSDYIKAIESGLWFDKPEQNQNEMIQKDKSLNPPKSRKTSRGRNR